MSPVIDDEQFGWESVVIPTTKSKLIRGALLLHRMAQCSG